MAILPSASTTIDESAGALAGATGYAVVLACARPRAPTQCRASSRRRRHFLISTDIIWKGVSYLCFALRQDAQTDHLRWYACRHGGHDRQP